MAVEAVNNQLERITYNVSEAEISALKDKYRDINIKDNGGYKLAVAGITEARSLRVNIEKRRKQLKAGALEFGRRVDSIAGDLTQKLLAIEIPLKEAKREIDEKKAMEKAKRERLEKERVKTIMAKIEKIMELTNKAVNFTAAELKEAVTRLETMRIDKDEFQEFGMQAIAAKTTALVWLRGLYETRVKLEEEQERMNSDRERQEIERQKLLEEKRQLSEKQKKVREEETRIIKEREKEQEAEQKRQAAAERKNKEIERAAQEAKRETENRAHRESIHAEVVDSFVDLGIQKQKGQELVDRISEQSLDHLAIIY